MNTMNLSTILVILGSFSVAAQVPDEVCLSNDSEEKQPCEHPWPKIRFRFNAETNSCEEFYFDNCDRPKNSFLKASHCFTKCVRPSYCYDEPVRGCCLSPETRYFYDWRRDRCRKFNFADEEPVTETNNFHTSADCENTCRPLTKLGMGRSCRRPAILKDTCSLDDKRVYFDMASGTCKEIPQTLKEFCIKQSNKFATFEDCKRQCRAF